MSAPEPEGFTRVHPISPFIRGGLVALAVVGYFVTQQIDAILSTIGDLPDAGHEGVGPHPLLQLGAAALVVVGALVLGLLSWWFTRFRLGEETLEMTTGAIFRQHREVRYDRIQAVDLVRPLLARLCGLSEVRIESAGGGDSHVKIAYLRRRAAEDVRSRLLRLAEEAHVPAPAAESRTDRRPEGHEPAEGPVTDLPGRGAAVRPVLAVPSRRIIASVLLSWDAVLVTLYAIGALILASFGAASISSGFLPVVLVNGLRAFGRLSRWYGLRIGLRGDTVTIERGLTDTRTSSVPLHRVQALEIHQPVLWRRAGWWSLKVNVAGARIGSATDDAADDVLVPVATTREVLDLLEVVTGDPRTTAEVASLVEGTPRGFVGEPRRARWLHPFAYRRIGYLPGTRAVITRGGWVAPRLQVVPWGRIQSLKVEQGPVARRLGLESVGLVSTMGPVLPEVEHLAQGDAERLADLASRRSSHARHRPRGLVGCDPTPDTVDCDR